MSRRRKNSVPFDDGPDDATQAERPPSRSQAKRDAKAMGPLAVRLVELPKSHLKRLELEEDLHDEIVECRRLDRTARQRQLKRIAQLLRLEDWREIESRIEG